VPHPDHAGPRVALAWHAKLHTNPDLTQPFWNSCQARIDHMAKLVLHLTTCIDGASRPDVGHRPLPDVRLLLGDNITQSAGAWPAVIASDCDIVIIASQPCRFRNSLSFPSLTSLLYPTYIRRRNINNQLVALLQHLAHLHTPAHIPCFLGVNGRGSS
jgi:hypothetical protein